MDKDREPGTTRSTAPRVSQQIYGPNVIRPLPDKHPLYELIGRVASEWAHFEHALDETIWLLAKMPPPIAPCITSQIMGVGGRCKAIILLAEVSGISEQTRKKYGKLNTDSYGAADRRARIVHDPWYMKMAGKEPAQFRAMPWSDRRFGPQEVTEAEVTNILELIRDLKKRALDLHTIVERELGASLETRA